MGKSKGLRGDARALDNALHGRARLREKEKSTLARFQEACEEDDVDKAAAALKAWPGLLTLRPSDDVFASALGYGVCSLAALAPVRTMRAAGGTAAGRRLPRARCKMAASSARS